MWEFPSDSVVKNPPASAGDASLIPGSGRHPGEGNGNPLQYSCLEKPMDRSLLGYSPWGLQRVGHDLATNQQQQRTDEAKADKDGNGVATQVGETDQWRGGEWHWMQRSSDCEAGSEESWGWRAWGTWQSSVRIVGKPGLALSGGTQGRAVSRGISWSMGL